jgi:hypothetical protein
MAVNESKNTENVAPATVVVPVEEAEEGRTYNPDGTRNPTPEELAAETGTAHKNVDDNNRGAEFRTTGRGKAQLDALIAERDAYKARGDETRAAQVEASIQALGYREEKGKAADNARAVNPSVEKRG